MSIFNPLLLEKWERRKLCSVVDPIEVQGKSQNVRELGFPEAQFSETVISRKFGFPGNRFLQMLISQKVDFPKKSESRKGQSIENLISRQADIPEMSIYRKR